MAGEHSVLVLARQVGALEPNRSPDRLLDVIGHIVLGFLPARYLRQEIQPVGRAGIHEEEEGIQALVPPHGGAVEHAPLVGDGDRHDVLGDLRKQRAEPEQVRLPAGGALRAHHQVAVAQRRPHPRTVLEAVPPQSDGRDRRDQLRQSTDAVRDGCYLPPEGG